LYLINIYGYKYSCSYEKKAQKYRKRTNRNRYFTVGNKTEFNKVIERMDLL